MRPSKTRKVQIDHLRILNLHAGHHDSLRRRGQFWRRRDEELRRRGLRVFRHDRLERFGPWDHERGHVDFVRDRFDPEPGRHDCGMRVGCSGGRVRWKGRDRGLRAC